MPFYCTIKKFRQHNDACVRIYEFEPRRKSPKNRFQLSAGLNLDKLDTILSGTLYLSPDLKQSRGSNSLNSASRCLICKTRYAQFENQKIKIFEKNVYLLQDLVLNRTKSPGFVSIIIYSLKLQGVPRKMKNFVKISTIWDLFNKREI